MKIGGHMHMSERMLQDEEPAVLLAADADIFWLLFGAILVFIMQAGFAMLEVGSVQAKNTKNILVKNLLDASLGAILWWLIGYGVALGGESDGADNTDIEHYVGETFYALSWNFGDRPTGDIYAGWLFQWAFAATAVTIVSGTVAERVTFTAYITYATVLLCLVYPVVVHSGWAPNGWAAPWRERDAGQTLLLTCGTIDFAGSGVVHMTGGVAALVGAIFIGARKGRFSASGEPIDIPGQSPILRNLGTFILWFGWFGFNGVSTLYIAGYGGVAAKTMVTTAIAAAAGCLTNLVLGKALTGIIDLDLANNGVLAGLVSITAGCSTVEPYGAFAIGVIGALVYYSGSKMLVFFKIDDVVDAIPVHCFCGCWGVISAALFATDFNYNMAYYERGDECAGAFYVPGGKALGTACAFVLFISIWVGGTMTIVFAALSALGLLRVSEVIEVEGLDHHEHGGVVGGIQVAAAKHDVKEHATDGNVEVAHP